MTLAAVPEPERAGPRIDAEAAERAAAALLSALGADLADEGLRETPRRMAAAMRAGVEAGRGARLAGRIPKRTHAEPSSPQLGLIGG